jgi:hypothetical protein
MDLKNIIQPVFKNLATALLLLTNEEYSKPCCRLNGSSIGAHTRHIIELFKCLLDGYDTGIVNYDSRRRNILIETDKKIAISLLDDITDGVRCKNKAISLQFSFKKSDMQFYDIDTNFYREFIYNLEHTIHHMAFIRIGICEVTSISLPEDFGVSPSTMEYKRSCVQ